MRNTNISNLNDEKITNPELRYSTDKKLKRINMTVFKRILTFLYYNSKTKKTNIAMNCGMSYDKCLLYLEWMNTLSLISNESDHGFELLSLSHRGIEFFEKNFKHN